MRLIYGFSREAKEGIKNAMPDVTDTKNEFIEPWKKLFSEQVEVRLEKRKKLEELTGGAYRNDLKPSTTASHLRALYGEKTKEELTTVTEVYSLTGRVLLVRDFGKAAFLQVFDGTDKFQIYISRSDLSEACYAQYKLLDAGDIVYAQGNIFRTNKGELSLHAKDFQILTKALRPLPEKFHGLTDPELRYRMRYVDTIMNEESREVLKKRSAIVHYLRNFFYDREFLEVETPMLHTVVGGAAAKPFLTHHNALDMGLNLRIAPELHLKRLVVGGFNRVFEISRCFRNEGLSIKHNPEFTQVEFYWAYATYQDLIQLTEDLFSGLARDLFKTEVFTFGDRQFSLKPPFQRLSMRDAVVKYAGISKEATYDRSTMMGLLKKKGVEPSELEKMSADKLMVACFEHFAESHLIDPTFITEFPTEVSPLARRNDKNQAVVDRFELFVNGWEVANGFSELNNPSDQLERFAEQAERKAAGDEEACDVDYDYVRALEYGLAPTAGEGIGIDRLVMLLTNSASIRDVILFPLLKRETFFEK